MQSGSDELTLWLLMPMWPGEQAGTKLEEAIDRGNRLLELARSLGDVHGEFEALYRVYRGHLLLSHGEQAFGLIAPLVQLGDRLGTPRGHHAAAGWYVNRGEWEPAQRHYAHTEIGAFYLCLAAYDRGLPQEGERYFAEELTGMEAPPGRRLRYHRNLLRRRPSPASAGQPTRQSPQPGGGTDRPWLDGRPQRHGVSSAHLPGDRRAGTSAR